MDIWPRHFHEGADSQGDSSQDLRTVAPLLDTPAEDDQECWAGAAFAAFISCSQTLQARLQHLPHLLKSWGVRSSLQVAACQHELLCPRARSPEVIAMTIADN